MPKNVAPGSAAVSPETEYHLIERRGRRTEVRGQCAGLRNDRLGHRGVLPGHCNEARENGEVRAVAGTIAPRPVDVAPQVVGFAPKVVDVAQGAVDVAPGAVEVAPQVVEVARRGAASGGKAAGR